MDQDRDDRIRARAHAIWEREGRPEGGHDAHWRQAERELAEEDAPTHADTSSDVPRESSGEEPARKASRRKR